MSYYRVVEAYHPETTIGFCGRTYPRLCLVEDSDGMRLLITGDAELDINAWVQAHVDGAQAIILVDPWTEEWHFCDATAFMECRTETQQHFVLSTDFMVPGTAEMLTYMQMLDALPDPVQQPVEGFVHLHTHSEFSPLDGLSTMDEIVTQVLADGQTALAVTDHGNCASHPALQKAAQKAGIKPIFGMEAYFVDDRFARGSEHKNDYTHLVLWAMDDDGLRNLWAMSTESYRDGFYYKPRLDWQTLERFHEGVMVSTACLRGPVVHPWLDGKEDVALANLSRLKRIFDDRLYIELHANQLDEQIRANKWLLDVSARYDVPTVAVVDSHYAEKCDQHTHRVWLSVQTDSDVADDSSLFGGNQNYHVMTEAEVRESLSYLGQAAVDEAIANTVRVANRCTAQIVAKGHNPTFSRVTKEHPDPGQHDVDRLLDICLKRWDECTSDKSKSQDSYVERFEREMKLIIDKEFCGYFLMVADQVLYAKEHGVLVGPGRGSGGGSLVAYLCGITEIDPVEHDLLFERFMTEGRTSLPDFDVDYPSSRKQFMLDYIAERWGGDHMATVGTHLRLQSKGVIRDTARAIQSTLPEDYFRDIDAISKIIEEAEAGTAGLGLSWEQLWAEHEDLLNPYKERYPELFALAEKMRDRLKTFSKHAAGVIIDPDFPLSDALPLRSGEDGGQMVTQFDMEALEELGFVKFDLLNLRNLDTIQDTVDLIEETTGYRVNPYKWREQYDDPYIYGEISEGWTLGIFQIETSSGTRLIKRFQPQTVAELADVITLVRPGPMRSGLTDQYLARRQGDEVVSHEDPRLESILAKSYGIMLYQEDIMAICMTLAGYDSNEADDVRKILGKKKIELAKVEGRNFVRRAVNNGTDRDVAESMWLQMEEFAKYSFNRAHAFAYALLGMWTAWLKFHYPVQFLTAAMSTVKKERIPEFVEEARRMNLRVLPPDVNESKEGFTTSDLAVRYGLGSVKGIGGAVVDAIMSAQPYSSWEDFLERKGPKCNAGHIKTLVHIGAFDSLVPNRRGLEKKIEVEAISGSDRCQFKDPETRNEVGLPCTFDWASEPPEIGRTGKPKKAKPLPKRCTRACRMFTPLPPPDPDNIEPYTDAEIRSIEMDMLGIYLSSTPFDRIPEEDREELATAIEVLSGTPGQYIVAAMIRAVRRTTDRYDRPMAHMDLVTERGSLPCVVFSSVFAQYQESLTPGSLVLAVVDKTPRGQNLSLVEPLDIEES